MTTETAPALAFPVTGKPAPKPGFYRDVPFEEYAVWDAVNSQILNKLRQGTPAHVFHDLLHGGGVPTRAKDLGGMTHIAVLEPKRFEAEFVVPPKVDRRYTEGKREWTEFCAANPDKAHVSRKDYDAAVAMRDSLMAHPTAGEFFRGQHTDELSIVWVDRETGVQCKARIDSVGYVGEYPVVGDVKTGDDISRRAMQKAVQSYGYHVQGAHYLDGLDTLVPIPAGNPFRRYVLFAVESSPPHLTAPYEIDDDAMVQGAETRTRLLKTWKRCLETGHWPGYHDGIELVSLPAWAFREWTPEIGD